MAPDIINIFFQFENKLKQQGKITSPTKPIFKSTLNNQEELNFGDPLNIQGAKQNEQNKNMTNNEHQINPFMKSPKHSNDIYSFTSDPPSFIN